MNSIQPMEKFFYMTGETLNILKTARNTWVSIMQTKDYGHICMMNGEVQSATSDERIYHETLVHPAMSTARDGQPKNVLIIGGGEGCTAREVLKWNSVEHVDMIDWDEEVVKYFSKSPMKELWKTESVWNDPRLNIKFKDIWQELNRESSRNLAYDCIIVDLFDPVLDTEESTQKWTTLVGNLPNWLSSHGSIVFFTGMRQWLPRTSYAKDVNRKTNEILSKIGEMWRSIDISPTFTNIYSYKTWIPSFGGESTFVLASSSDLLLENMPESSHLRKLGVWQSYLVWNDLGQTG